MTLEMFIWNDPHTVVDEWTALRDLCMDSTRVLTVGLVVKENDLTVAVAIGVDREFNQVTGTVIIPKAAIQKREVLAEEEQIETWAKA